jgi:23S rRNA (uracil1939-C5)-methyltransferase
MTYHIDNIAFGGEGVARKEGLAVFIPFTLPGEEVEAEIFQKKSRFARAKLLCVTKNSPDRIAPLCPYFTVCGGCKLQHASYDKQLEIKRMFVEDSLKRIGKISTLVPPVIPSSTHFSYRRHISLKLQKIEGVWQLCFTSLEGNPLAITSCFLFHDIEDDIFMQIQKSLSKIPSHYDFDIRAKIIKKGEGYVLAFTSARPMQKKEKGALSSLFSLPALQGLILQTPAETIEKGDCTLTFSCQNLDFFYSPFSFVQNHPEQSEKIVELLINLVGKSKKIVDLYCGIGVSTLAFASSGKEVLGIELSETATTLAKKNAEKNQLKADFFCCPAEDCKEKITAFQPDTIVVNPPKGGLHPDVLSLFSSPCTQQILYVSCHPPTLARDAFLLEKMGFTIEVLQSFDMFPQTTHVETVVKFIKTQ